MHFLMTMLMEVWEQRGQFSNMMNMRCKIADLIVEVPTAGGLDIRCKYYVWNGEEGADIIIRTELYDKNLYDSRISEQMLAYMESSRQFSSWLVQFNGFYLHSSAVVLEGKAYLFSGPCGAGKSTHTRLWQSTFGPDAHVINDDKPALRRIDGKWYAYGTPWCGKDGININEKAPLAGVCFLKKAPENKIRRLSRFEAMQRILGQTIYKFNSEEQLDKLLGSLEVFLKEIPVYELENVPEPEAAKLSFETMRKGAQEAGL